MHRKWCKNILPAQFHIQVMVTQNKIQCLSTLNDCYEAKNNEQDHFTLKKIKKEKNKTLHIKTKPQQTSVAMTWGVQDSHNGSHS